MTRQNVREVRVAPTNRSAPATEFECRISSLIHAESMAITAKLRLELSLPCRNSTSQDEAMIAITLASERFAPPLSHNEVTVLACVLYMWHIGKTADYGDVLNLTYRFRSKSMNATTVYNTFRALLDRGLIDDKGRELDEATERLARAFAINEFGKEALRLAVLNAQRLDSFQKSDAA